MNEIIEKENIKIENLIYEIRGVPVMLDSDLARLYKCKNGTKEVNQAVKNNKLKFSERFSWILTDEEYLNLRSKILTSSLSNHGGRRNNPRVFTEQAIYMLATILKTEIAAKISIAIMDAFVSMRKYLSSNLIEQKYINNIVLEDHSKIIALETSFNKFDKKQEINKIFFEGQIYDANSLLLDILNKAKNEIIIIDNYAGKELLDELRSINVSIKIVSKNIDDALKKKYMSQYSNVEFIINNSFHDRFIIIDKKILYTIRSSLKDIGKKCFAINEMSDKEILNQLLNVIMH